MGGVVAVVEAARGLRLGLWLRGSVGSSSELGKALRMRVGNSGGAGNCFGVLRIRPYPQPYG